MWYILWSIICASFAGYFVWRLNEPGQGLDTIMQIVVGVTLLAIWLVGVIIYASVTWFLR